MSQPRQVVVVHDPKTGETSYEVVGMPGTGCTDLTNALTQGKEVTEHHLTSEYCEQQERPDYINGGTDSSEE